MNTKKLTVFLFLTVLFSSCSVVDKLLTFTISNQTSFKINSGFPVNSPFDVPTPEVTTNSSSEFKNNNTKTELVKDVKLKELKLTITSPNDKTFRFLKSVRLFISTDGQKEIELAFLDDINASTNTLNLNCTSQKLDQYIKAASYKIRTQAVTKETVAQEIAINADMKFQVTADPF
jgi:hypothetical protein